MSIQIVEQINDSYNDRVKTLSNMVTGVVEAICDNGKYSTGQSYSKDLKNLARNSKGSVDQFIDRARTVNTLLNSLRTNNKDGLYGKATQKEKEFVKKVANNSSAYPAYSNLGLLGSSSLTSFEKNITDLFLLKENVIGDVDKNSGKSVVAINGLTVQGSAVSRAVQTGQDSLNIEGNSPTAFKVETTLKSVTEATSHYVLNTNTLEAIDTAEGFISGLLNIVTNMAANTILQVEREVNRVVLYGGANNNDSVSNTVRSYGMFTDNLYYTEAGNSFAPTDTTVYNAKFTTKGTWNTTSNILADLIKSVSILASVNGQMPTAILIPTDCRPFIVQPLAIGGSTVAASAISYIKQQITELFGASPDIIFNNILSRTNAGSPSASNLAAYAVNADISSLSVAITKPIQQIVTNEGGSIKAVVSMAHAGLCQKAQNAIVKVEGITLT